MSEVTDAFRRIERPNVRTNTSVQSFHCALRSFAQACLQRMEQQLYRVKVRRIRWQVAEACTNSLDRLFHTSDLVEPLVKRRNDFIQREVGFLADEGENLPRVLLQWRSTPSTCAWVRKSRFHESAAPTGSQSGQFLLCREGDDLIAPRIEKWIARYEHRHDALPGQSREGVIELSVGTGIKENDRPTDRARCFRKFLRLLGDRRVLRVEQDADKWVQWPVCTSAICRLRMSLEGHSRRTDRPELFLHVRCTSDSSRICALQRFDEERQQRPRGPQQ